MMGKFNVTDSLTLLRCPYIIKNYEVRMRFVVRVLHTIATHEQVDHSGLRERPFLAELRGSFHMFRYANTPKEEPRGNALQPGRSLHPERNTLVRSLRAQDEWVDRR